MELEHAEHTLETIRTLMERSQRYEHISGYSGLVGGLATLAGCAVLGLGLLPWGYPASFVVVWTAVFAVAFAGHVLFTFGRAHQRGEPVWSRQARTVLLAVLPAFGAALVVTALIWRLGRADLLPAIWLTLYGCGVLATSFFAPRTIAWLGGTCFVLGSMALLAPRTHPVLTMAAGFGLTHIAFGIGVLVAERRETRNRAFWAQIERLAAINPRE
ncbi:MAG TPA: hypothetical protein VMV72_05585 [Verrucomicrobiae bacterium]|nr:hypothetical protein [Verrucomicrobiae bacterium]